jgi:hypothetical protein
MTTATSSKPIDWPLWWFARLEKAVEAGDHVAAAEAQKELARLGVDVRYGQAKRRRRHVKKEAADAE